MKLSPEILIHAQPQAKPFKLNDGAGLYAFIAPSGGKLWRYPDVLVVQSIINDAKTATVHTEQAAILYVITDVSVACTSTAG